MTRGTRQIARDQLGAVDETHGARRRGALPLRNDDETSHEKIFPLSGVKEEEAPEKNPGASSGCA
jgi:hypothetical protein